MATSPRPEKSRRVAASLWLSCATAALVASGAAHAQGLEKFQPKESPQERLTINAAIQQCVRMIQQKTVQARVSIKGPCRKESGEWTGVDKSDAGFKLRFSVTPAESSAGTLISALQGDAVRVFCTADTQGAVTQFEDLKEGVRESFSSTGLCWPAGD